MSLWLSLNTSAGPVSESPRRRAKESRDGRHSFRIPTDAGRDALIERLFTAAIGA
jgi:hypothetical protein